MTINNRSKKFFKTVEPYGVDIDPKIQCPLLLNLTFGIFFFNL